MNRILLFKVLLLSIIFSKISFATNDTTIKKDICESISFSRSQLISWKTVTHEEFIRLKSVEGDNFSKNKKVNHIFRVPVSEYSIDYTFFGSGEKIRMERRCISYVHNTRAVFDDTQVYDGERTYSYQIQQSTKNQVAFPSAAIYPGLNIGAQGNPIALCYTINFQTWDGEKNCWYPLEDFLSDKTEAGYVKYLGDESIDGISCNVFLTEKIDGILCKVWIAPEYMYCLKKTEITTPNELIVSNYNYEQNNELWILKSRTEESFDLKNGEKLQINKFITNDFSPFFKAAADVFILKYPQGLEINRFDEHEFIPYKQW